MGFFSWKTADTSETIYNDSTNYCRPVFLLQPNGENVRELSYEGYGKFGDVDAYAWLARYNLPDNITRNMNQDALREIGIHLELGTYIVHPKTGKEYSVYEDLRTIDPEIAFLNTNWNNPCIELDGLSPNDFIKKHPASVRSFELKFPLKFSFNAKADYKKLPASKVCPTQGYFVGDEDEVA